MSQRDCPDRDQLGSFTSGQIDEVCALQISAHLDECPQCRAFIETVGDNGDTLAEALRRPVPADQYADEAAQQRAAALIQAIGREPSVATGQRTSPEATVVDDWGVLGQYQLLAKLGEGGMGAVYKALHTRLKRLVALKVLPADRMGDQHAVDRFRREMEAVGNLDHPNIVRATDAGVCDDTHFLVMELVDGIDLSQLVRQSGPLPIADACELIRQAALGLQHAHQRGMVHRDVKPSNLMLTLNGEGQAQVKVLDMGLALLAAHHAAQERHLTTTGQLMGTLDYMAPEQSGDSHQVDIRADVYSLGATLYKLLTGEVPFPASQYNTPLKLLTALATAPVPSIAGKRNDLSVELVAIVDRMLAKNPQDRFATPGDVARALATHASGADLPARLAEVRSNSDRTARDEDGAADKIIRDTVDLYSAASCETAPGIQPHGGAVSTPAVTPAHAAAAKRGRAKASNNFASRILAIAAGLGGLLLLGLVTLYIQTNQGTLIVEIDDPQGLIQVHVVGEDILISDKQMEGKAIKLRVGEHKLHVTRGDIEFDSDNFRLKRGAEVVLRVKLIEGKVQVVHHDQVIGQGTAPEVASAMPSTASDSENADRVAAQAVLARGGEVVVYPMGADGSKGAPIRVNQSDQLPKEPFQLSQVNFTDMDIGDDDLRVLRGLSKLSGLYAAQYGERKGRLTDAGLAHIADIRTLGTLVLRGNPQITDQGLAHLANLPVLLTLDLCQTEVVGHGLAHLKNSTKLFHLEIDSCPVTPEGFAALPHLPELQILDLQFTGINDASLEQLDKCPKLQSLHISDTPITVAGVLALSRLPALEQLTIGSGSRPETTLSSDAIRAIGTIPRLKYIRFTVDTTFEEGALAPIGALPLLEQLRLEYNRSLTDADLKHLAALKTLRSLTINDTQVTVDGVAQLQRALPECNIRSSFTAEQIHAATANLAPER